LHRFHEFFRGYVVKVPLRGCEIRVTELLLDDWHRDTFHHEFVAHGMPQTVRVNSLLDTCLPPETMQQRPDIRGMQGSTLKGAEER
jgi:hypothetical protein